MNDRWKTVLRSLVLAEWVLILLLGAGGSVPQELQGIANQTYASDPRPFHLFLAVACSLGLLKIVAQIGLFLFKRWARPLFTLLAISAFVVPFVVTVLPLGLASIPDPPLAQSLAVLLSMMDGAIVALAYASPVGALFVRGVPQTGPGMQDAG